MVHCSTEREARGDRALSWCGAGGPSAVVDGDGLARSPAGSLASSSAGGSSTDAAPGWATSPARPRAATGGRRSCVDSPWGRSRPRLASLSPSARAGDRLSALDAWPIGDEVTSRPRIHAWVLWAGVALGVAGVAAHVGWILSGSPKELETLFDLWIYNGVLFLAGLLFFIRAFASPDLRGAWISFGLGLTAWALGDTYWVVALADVKHAALSVAGRRRLPAGAAVPVRRDRAAGQAPRRPLHPRELVRRRDRRARQRRPLRRRSSPRR